MATKTLNLYDESSPIRLKNPKVGPMIDWHGRTHDLRNLEPKWAERMADDPLMRDVERAAKVAEPAKVKAKEKSAGDE